MNDEIPPLAPDDKPFDFDDEPSPPFFLSRWWVAIAMFIVLALLAGLAAPIIDFW